jgi:6-pyruvoyltetrahydropterin/6-carboxytetrahydropterin synthase
LGNPILYLTRREHFNAAHKLYNDKWSEEKNKEVFGKCANKNWHGHNFDLHVTIKGSPNPDTGFIMDLKDLKGLIREEVIELFDHMNLNEDVPVMKNILPSIENIVMVIWDLLKDKLPENCSLHKLLLYETDHHYVEYYGE